MRLKEAVLDVAGAESVVSVYAIESDAKEIDGVKEIRVDPDQGTIRVLYDGGIEIPQEVAKRAGHLGYRAVLQKAGAVGE